MKSLMATLALAGILASTPALAGDDLDFHLFEADYGQSGEVPQAYSKLQQAVPQGMPTQQAVARLRAAGAHCQSANRHSNQLECFYREQISVDNYVNTYATWDLRLQLAEGKVQDMSVERTTAQY